MCRGGKECEREWEGNDGYAVYTIFLQLYYIFVLLTFAAEKERKIGTPAKL